ncbi:unnamed protein product [Schistocephalus solidus]|uniref:EF-hand domain-containing protein n=1 Tax=Schistocephalus solidus TaxID=70667 RepID=A0A183SMT3_SCHSO|nr:unnamed protein product [Schistocephalus solidus]
MAVACPLRNFEECLRNTANEKGVRVSEYFLDFDKLRSGKVTDNIFFRILTRNFGITLNEEQRDLLRGKYGVGDKINWRKFVGEIDKTLDPNDLSVTPKQQLKRIRFQETECLPNNFAGVDETFRPILSRINQHITYQGYSIRQCYKQFDNQNIGKVSESQFYRAFPGPKDITEAELCAIAKHYSVPNDPGMVDYLRLEQDLWDLAQAEQRAKEGYPPKPDAPDIHINTKAELLVPSVHMVLERIGFAVHTRGIRVLDHFLDYDPLRHDEVSEHQFACVLNLALSEAAHLSRFDIQQLANFFRSSKNPDKIAYREFCRAADFRESFCICMKALAGTRPSDDLQGHHLPLQNLTEDEEIRVSNILSTLREKVRTQRIQTYPMFRDYDTSTALTRTMTPLQLGRALHFLQLDVGSEDCRLLAKKFADPVTKYVNYAALCEAIDPMFQASALVRDVTQEIAEDAGPPPKIGDFVKPAQRCDWDAISTPIAMSSGDSVDLETLMARLRHLVLVNRIRLKGFFEDFDPLRSGRITKSQFMRGLSNASISRIGLHDLTPAQCNKLFEKYKSSEDPKTVRWLDFVNDVDTIFTLPELEKQPLARVPPQEIFLVPKPGCGDWSSATEEMRENYEHGMRALRRCVMERSLQLKPEFLAFDKLNRGHVTLSNFRQIMSMLNIHLPVEDLDVIASRYADDDGFNYATFILDLIPLTEEQLHYKYPDRIQNQRLKYLYEKKQIEREPVMRDAEGVLDMIKKKASGHLIFKCFC